MSHKYVHFISCGPTKRIWGMSPAERTLKQLQKNLTDIDVVDDIETFTDKKILILRDDVIYDTSLLLGMMVKPEHLFKNADGIPIGGNIQKSDIDKTILWMREDGDASGKPILKPEEAGKAYRDELRKKSNPYALIANPKNKKDVEWFLFQQSYKGVTDLVTKYVWPVPAYHVTRICSKIRLSPNMVTSIGAILMFIALHQFWVGNYGLGLLAGWVMTFLDTVDGKLARVTLTSSQWGNIFDHGIDLLHPPFWYIAWGIGLTAYGTVLPENTLAPLLIVMFASYVLGRLCEGYFIKRFGFHVFVWRKIDSFFRLIVARRNPNMIVMTVCWIFGHPDIALYFIVYWHVFAVFAHCVQILNAEWNKKRGKEITSWLQA